MSSIDTRVVEAKFDNAQFLQGVKSTMDSLANLQRSLEAQGNTRGLENIGTAVDHIASKFNALTAVATAALTRITFQAVEAGERLLKSFTIAPIADGLHEYETQLNSIQTILANTQWQGTTLKDVNEALHTLNLYADKTIYNFGQMARNIGTFTAAGVKLDTSVTAIKGIANLAAVSGSNAQQASTAMYQLSQAISSGTVKLMDWNSVVNAGMGGKVFQDALKETARVHGVSIDKMIKEQGSFRNTLQEGWLTSKILTDTLAHFTMEDSKANRALLERQGYTEQQIEGILKMGKTATDAATKVKTFTQLMGTLREAAGSGWAQTWQEVIGNFSQAKKLWTGVYEVLGGAITKSANARNKVLKDWAALGGRKAMIDAVKNAWNSLLSVLDPIRDAFREVFPRKTGQQLADMTKSVRDFFEHFKMGEEAANNLKRTFAGFFAVLDIGWQIIKQTAKFIFDLFGALTEGEGSGGFLAATANIGDFLVALDEAVKHGKGLEKFFAGLKHVLMPIITVIHAVIGALAGLFDFDAPSAEGISKSFTPLQTLGHSLVTIWDKVIDVLGKVFGAFAPIAEKFAEFFGNFAHQVSAAFGGVDYEDILHTINTGLFAGVVLLIKKVVDKFTKPKVGASMGFFDTIKETFRELTNTLQTMQKVLQAAILLEIAIAVGILTVSLIALSKVNAKDLAKALSAITVEFGQLMASLWLFNKLGGVTGLASTAAGLILFATALRILTSSVKALAELGWEELAKGLIGTTVLIGGLVAAVRGMGELSGGMVSAGAGLVLLAAGVKVLASAVRDISDLSWTEMGKGLAGIATLLVSLTLFTKFAKADKMGITSGAGLLLLATAIKVLASAATDFARLSWEEITKGLASVGLILGGFVIFSKNIGKSAMGAATTLLIISGAMLVLSKALKEFAEMSWQEIAKAMVVLGGSMLILVLAMRSMESAIRGAAAMLIISGAMLVMSKVLQEFATMSWGEIVKGLVTLAGALLVMVVAANAMEGSVAGSAAMLIMAGAVKVLAGVLVTLGNMSWIEIVKGLGTLTAALILFAATSIVLSESIPFMLGFAAAVALLGGGIFLLGTGIGLLAAGLTAFVLSIISSISALVGSLPVIVEQVGLLISAMATMIKNAGPAMVTAISAVIQAVAKAVIKNAPIVYRAIQVFVENFLRTARKLIPDMAETGLEIMVAVLKSIRRHEDDIVEEGARIIIKFLNGVAKKMPDIVTAATNLIVSFLEGIADNLTRIQNAGVDIIIAWIKGIGSNAVRIANAALDTIVEFINGLADAINTHADDLREAGWNLAKAIVNGMTGGLAAHAGDVIDKAKDIAGSAIHAVTHPFGIGGPSKTFCKIGKYAAKGLANGLVGGKDDVKAAWGNIHGLLKDAISSTKQDIADYEARLTELRKHATKNADEIARVEKKLADARREHDRAKAALIDLNDKYKDEYEHLERLGKKYDEYSEKIQKANQDLKDAIRTRNDYQKQTTQMLQQSPDINKETTLGDFLDQEKYQLADILKLTSTLQKLRKRGLSDRAYKMLLDKGVDALPLAEQILAGGQKSIDEVNDLQSEIHKAAKELGTTGSKELYQAGVDAAQGIVDGLKKKRKEIADTMDDIADRIVHALKKKLGIKSPSKVMHGLGIFITKGLAGGLLKALPVLTKNVERVGDSAVETMRKTLSRMSEGFEMSTDVVPTITPILDLSEVRKNAPEMRSLLDPGKISVDGTYSRATGVAELQAKIKAMKLAEIEAEKQQAPPGDIVFNQTNNSPKALSTAEIYRQTKSQISRAKGVVTDAA